MNNPVLKIAVCNRRIDTRYKNREETWQAVKDRCRVPVRTTETVAEYPKLSKERRDSLKDHGGFVGGWLRNGIRKNGNVISRCLGCLDADNIPVKQGRHQCDADTIHVLLHGVAPLNMR